MTTDFNKAPPFGGSAWNLAYFREMSKLGSFWTESHTVHCTCLKTSKYAKIGLNDGFCIDLCTVWLTCMKWVKLWLSGLNLIPFTVLASKLVNMLKLDWMRVILWISLPTWFFLILSHSLDWMTIDLNEALPFGVFAWNLLYFKEID